MGTLNGWRRMVLDYLIDRVQSKQWEREDRLREVTSLEALAAWQGELRGAIDGAFSPLPSRTPYNLRRTGLVEMPGIRLHKLTFESRPGCLVTANLYEPTKVDGPAPAVLVPCGHSMNGKAIGLYREACMRLALNGFITLIYDPFNQGERDQYALVPDRECVAGCCAAHNMMTKQLELLGEWFGTWRTWDGIRALDVLLDWPGVDRTRVGLTGNSGGGTLTTWLWAVDDRFTMAAPGCFITTWLANLENELPADGEQYPPGLLGAGLELGDLLASRAPKPLLLLGQEYDFFDRRGLRWVHEQLAPLYDLHDRRDDLGIFLDRGPHGFSAANQRAMVAFFRKQAGLGPGPDVALPELPPEADCLATPEGNVIKAGATPVFEFFGEKARALAAARPQPDRDGLRSTLAGLLALPRRHGVPHYRIGRTIKPGDRFLARYPVETEPGIFAILHRPLDEYHYGAVLDVEPEIHLYLPHVASEDDLREDALATRLGAGDACYALDVRGLGESLPELLPEETFFDSYGKDYMFHGYGLMLSESYLGRRLHDVLATLDLLAANGAKRIHLYGRGQGAILALFAAVLDSRPASLTLRHAPLSFQAWAEAPLVAWPAANFVRGMLHHADVADCLRHVSCPVRLEEPWGVDMQPLTPEQLARALADTGIPRDLTAM